MSTKGIKDEYVYQPATESEDEQPEVELILNSDEGEDAVPYASNSEPQLTEEDRRFVMEETLDKIMHQFEDRRIFQLLIEVMWTRHRCLINDFEDLKQHQRAEIELNYSVCSNIEYMVDCDCRFRQFEEDGTSYASWRCYYAHAARIYSFDYKCLSIDI